MANAYVDALVRALAQNAGQTAAMPGAGALLANRGFPATAGLNLADRGYPTSNGANDAYSAAALAALANARQSNLASRGFPSTAMPTTIGRPTRINKFSPTSHMKQR